MKMIDHLLHLQLDAKPNLLGIAKQLADPSARGNVSAVLQGVSLKRKEIMR